VVDTAKVEFIEYADKRANRLAPSLVSVHFDIPFNVNGTSDLHYVGSGLIIDKKDGLVLVDRNTVPMSMGDVRIVFSGALDIPAKVIFVHPLHNISIIQYDPKLLGETGVEEAVLRNEKLESGDKVWLVALKNGQEILVEDVFRESNLDAISLNNAPSSQGGVLTDKEGDVLAHWLSFAYGSGNKTKQYEWGVPTEIVMALLEQWRCCNTFSSKKNWFI